QAAAPTAPPSRQYLDAAVAHLQAHKQSWAALPIRKRIQLLEDLTRSTLAVADRWSAAAIAAEGLDPSQPVAGEEPLVGPYFTLRNLRLLRRTLADIETHGHPRIPGPVRTLPNNQVAAQVFPVDLYDRLFYTGVTADV